MKEVNHSIGESGTGNRSLLSEGWFI